MKKIILILVFAALSVYGFSQSYVMSGLNGQTISTCSGTFTLGSYSAGQNFTMTVCSNDPVNNFVRLNITGGYSFPAGTSLCVYDGNSTAAPLLECWDNTTTSGMIATAATNMNSTGCLTFVFTGGATGASWSGTFLCEFQCMPRSVDIVSAVPAIGGDGYINVCWDETANQSMPVQFTAAGTYPTPAYPLSDATNTFYWNFQDGSPIQSGVGLTSVTHNFPARQGYTVIVTITDDHACSNTNAVSQRVRVSRAPVWNTTTTATDPDAICMGEEVDMCGYYSGVTWNSAVVPQVAAPVPLPDGSGVCYESNLMQNQFEPGQTLESVNDLLGIHMDICHTFIGDLTFFIQCPNGQTVQMGIQGGSGTNLGNPPSAGYWYVITPTATTTMQTAAASYTTLPAGNYASYASLAGLVNCPLNGQWTIRICDNWSIDSGTIFGWWIEFDPSLFPEIWSYTPTYTPTSWEGQYGSEIQAPTNQNCAVGTYLTTATPDVNSTQPFIFTITDNFGCEHDTSLNVTVYYALDPNCCIIPTVDAGSNAAVCALAYQLQATPLEYATSSGYWELVSGPGTVSFADSENPITVVTVNAWGAYTFAWHELYQGNPGCANSDQVVITFNETFDPTLTDVSNICVNTAPFIIQSVDLGTLSCSPNPSLLNTTTGQFNPTLPGNYTITNTGFDDCTGQNVSDNITFTVYDEIEVLNFEEDCGLLTDPDYFNIDWDVVGSQGNPFTGYLVNGVTQATAHFNEERSSPDSYNYTVTDANGCSSIEIQGFRDCGCPFYAGTMGSLQTIILCEDECTEPEVTHNGNEETEGGSGLFEFMIHTGNNIPLEWSDTPNFCLNDFGGDFNTIYYVSAICGFPTGPGGHANITTGCYSIASGTPVMWMQNPIAHAGSNRDTCGLVIQLDGNVPEAGMYGYWTSTCPFFAVNGTTHTQPDAIVMATAYADCTFTWNVANGECVASDDVLIRFLATPNPYAGDDQVLCGNTAIMAGVASMSGTTFTWTGSGTSFNPQSSLTAQAQISNYGTYEYTLTESNAGCYGQDEVLITYVQPPSPMITPGTDSVCGVHYDLSVITKPDAEGVWAAYESDGVTLIVPQPIFTPSPYSHNPHVQIGNYVGLNRPVVFIWEETNMVMGLECVSTAFKPVVFLREPLANVGPNTSQEICGNCVTFAADLTGSEWATEHYWIPKLNQGGFTNPEGSSSPTATFCAVVPAAFGDTAYIETQFYWAVKNGACISLDTLHVIFYQQPVANAGLDDVTCGNNFPLEAFYDITETVGYTPEGIWSVYNAPVGQSANFAPPTDNNSLVTVSEVGIWNFVFRENNANATYCYSTDTVQIEFVEIPVIYAGPDKDVCGTATVMEGVSGGYSGSWLPTAGATFTDFTSPTTPVNVGGYDDLSFTWMESNQATTSSDACTVTDEVIITFWRVPSPTIQTDFADSTVCGLTFEHLRAELPGSEILGYWYSYNPAADFLDEFDNNTSVTMPSYGYHDFYWIEETGPNLTPGFCNDTAGPLTIRFIEVPQANAGGDTLFCGYCGSLHALPSIGTGVWSTPSAANVDIEVPNSPTSPVCSDVLNTGNLTNPYFTLIWTEDNSNGCTDKDTMQVVFARVPTSEIDIIEPKCFGEPATIAAAEDSLQQYSWNFYSGIVDRDSTNAAGGIFESFVYWNGEDTAHTVSLIATNYWGCQSPINIDTIQEPPIPSFDITYISDTCALGKGGIIFGDTLGSSAFYWIDPNVGPEPGSITTVYNLPAGEYGIHTSYLTPNIVNYAYYLSTFGTANCVDTFYYEIETIGMIDAEMSVSADIILEDLVAPNATVVFLNTSDYDDVSKRCEWHFDDGTVVKSCDELIEHIYTESGCYEPFLIVMNRDLPECRDTAELEACIFVDDASKLEIPNIFSPNGDGVNDFYQVKAQTLRTFSGVIMNRWGRPVYSWENWEEYEAGWDGKLSGGTLASPGVYYYVIKAEGLDGTPYNEHGALHLMRE